MTCTQPRMAKIPHKVIVKAPGLLDMAYKVSELSQDLDIPVSTLRGWLKLGAPHERDHRKKLWINGKEFAGWVECQKKPKGTPKLKNDQAYCLHCRQAVQLLHPEVREGRGKLILIRGTCANCGSIINRGGRNGKSH